MTKEIAISVCDRVASQVGGPRAIVSDNTDYVIQFVFEEEWQAYPTKTVLFVRDDGLCYPPVILENGADRCSFPRVNGTKHIKIGVTADGGCSPMDDSGGGQIQTSTPAEILVLPSVLELAGQVLDNGSCDPAAPAEVWNWVLQKLDELEGQELSPEQIAEAVEQYLTENPVTGEKGDPGSDGITPHIGENGNWWIGDTDTGVKADASGGGDGTWRTIAEIQTDGTVNQYEITQDADGNPLNLTEMIIRYVGLKGETVNSYQAVWINDVQVSYRHALTTTAATKYETFWMRKTGKYIYGICNEATADGISGMNTSWRAGGIYLSREIFPNDEVIRKIKLGNSYAAGTDYLNGITITILGK